MLSIAYDPQHKYEIGIDEAGRGPLFGRLYVAAVVLPKHIAIDDTKSRTEVNWSSIKDSKKIKSDKKMKLCAEFVQRESVAYSIHYIEHDRIDDINIRQAVFEAMHNCIADILQQLKSTAPVDTDDVFLLIDGNDFKPYRTYDAATSEIHTFQYKTVEGGDNTYLSIAAASILAKYHRDEYIRALCALYPELVTRYHMDKNMGYGTKAHLDGIAEHGITQWHRRTYGRCKDAELCPITQKD